MSWRVRVLALTSDRPRHRALLDMLSAHADVTAFMETRGPIERSPIQEQYFARVEAAEREVFGDPCPKVPVKTIPMGSLSACDDPWLWRSDYDFVIVFGSSWIKEPLLSRLLAVGHHKAINLHAGLAPEYRGTACNFWAEYDGFPQCVAMTIMELSAKIDDGAIFDTASHGRVSADPFRHGMVTVRWGQKKLIERLTQPQGMPEPYPQNSRDTEALGYEPDPRGFGRRRRYSRAADFTDAICAEYLARLDDADKIGARR